ncbi:hypothetical protein WH95_00220 [Kiloniella litopenaei]|uniref:DUF3010 family protein n=1 Tax=Kiloniella litopenaei TaxID=1549748 RepID=A0A0M2RG82_9PROT|nr:DUF3010 family protein [Kiloniella litopenaei]KKJ78573.1 hypothetical protein WH95_00220 [Kiloniella litopenaei]
MKLCGIELKGNDAVLVVLEISEKGPKYIDLPTRKIALGESDNAVDVIRFQDEIATFFVSNNISKAAIKKRAKKGKFAGGPDTFKMEALIQVIPDLEVELVTPQALAAMEKKHDIIYPSSLKKYQEVAYLVGVWLFK